MAQCTVLFKSAQCATYAASAQCTATMPHLAHRVTNFSRLNPTLFLFSDIFWVKFEKLQRPGRLKEPQKDEEVEADLEVVQDGRRRDRGRKNRIGKRSREKRKSKNRGGGEMFEEEQEDKKHGVMGREVSSYPGLRANQPFMRPIQSELRLR